MTLNDARPERSWRKTPLPGNMGIYSIQCLPNNRIYIGASTSMKVRIRVQMSLLNTCRHPIKEMQADFDKYGRAAFVGNVVMVVRDRMNLFRIERELLHQYRESHSLYNRLIHPKHLGHQFGFTIREDLLVEIRKRAKKSDRSMSCIVNELLYKALAK